MKRNRSSTWNERRCRGAAAVEFAIIAPLFFLLLAGIMEFGQAFRIQHALSIAARHGARAASVDGSTNAMVIQKVTDHCARSLGVEAGSVTVAIAVGGSAGGDVGQAVEGQEVTVTVSVPYSAAGVGFYASTFANSTLSSSCTFDHN